jgi:hypothetical protein
MNSLDKSAEANCSSLSDTLLSPWYNKNRQVSDQMVISMETSNVIPALLRAKTNMGAAIKDASNPFFKSKYADLNAVKAACEPALAAEKIGVFQPIIQKDGKSYVRTLLLHESGEYFGGDTEIVCAKQNDPQAYGSAITYARRYGLQSLVGLGAEDDDGESAMNRSSAKTTPAASKPASAPRASFKKPTASAPQTAQVTETVEGWE